MSYFNYSEFEWEVSNLLDDACDTAKDNVRYEIDSAIESAFDDIDMESLLESVWDKAQEDAGEDIEEEVRNAKDEMWSALSDYFKNPLAEKPSEVFSRYNADEFIEKAMKDILTIRVGDEVVFTEVDEFGETTKVYACVVSTDAVTCAVMDCHGEVTTHDKDAVTRTGRSYPQLIEIFSGLNVELA